MAYQDISGKLEVHSSSDQKEIIERLSDSLYSLKINATIQDDGELIFTIPFIKTVTRGYVFQGISSGAIEVKQSDTNQLTIEYRLTTLPIRFVIITMALWIAIGIPFVINQLGEGINFQSYLPFAAAAITMFSVVILVGRYIIKYKFSSFLKKSLTGKYFEIKQPAWKNQIAVKKIAIISCSGILFLTLLTPAVFFFSTWNMRAKVVWEYPIKSAVMSPPLIAGSTVYFGSLGNVEQAAFYALEKETGKEIWVKPLNKGMSSSPILVDDMVCFGADDGVFRCLGMENGITKWEFGPEQRNLDTNKCDSCALKLNSPMVNGSTIYVGSHDYNLYALNIQNGQLLWSFPANGTVFDAPALADGILYVGSQDGNIYALNAASGDKIRHYHIPRMNEAGEQSGVYATPIIDSNTIYAVNGTLTAVDIQTGAIKWQVLGSSMYEDQISSDPILFKNSIIVSTTENIYAVDKASGSIKWKYSGIKGGIFFTPTLHEEVIYFGDSNGYLYGINANTGRLSFRYNMNYLDFTSYTNFFQDFAFPPATDGETIYVKWLNHFYGIQHKK